MAAGGVATGSLVVACGPMGQAATPDHEKRPLLEDNAPKVDPSFFEDDEPAGAGAKQIYSDYYPCAGKSCGQACTECAPDDDKCAEVLIGKQCDLEGACVRAPVQCPTR